MEMCKLLAAQQEQRTNPSYRRPFAVWVWRLESAAVRQLGRAVQIHGLIWKSSLTFWRH